MKEIRSCTRKPLSQEHKKRISAKLKGRKKPPRTEEHRKNLSLAFKGRSYKDRFGDKAEVIKRKISKSNTGKKRIFKNKEVWRKNLSTSLKGRSVWNKGKKGEQEAWNKINLPEMDILKLYTTENKTMEQIANKHNVSRSTILRVLKKKGAKIKTNKEYLLGKTFEERYGKEKSDELKKKLSEKVKGRKITWGDRISRGIKRHYQNHPVTDEYREKRAEISKNLWKDKEFRQKVTDKHKQRLREHPEELERLKRMQPIGISKIEQRMLEFLKQHFKEGEDFLFDKQDSTGKTFYRPDFQFIKQKIIIELYGYYTHFTKEGMQKDRIREYYLKKAGWKMYKFNFLEIERDYLFKKTKEKVRRIING